MQHGRRRIQRGTSIGNEIGSREEVEIRRLLRRADDVRKAGPGRVAPEAARARATQLLAHARDLLDHVADAHVQLDLAEQVARRVGDLDREDVEAMTGPSPGVAPAPTSVDDPGRVPPGQHLTAGWPVLHVGAAPEVDEDDAWSLVVTGRVRRRVSLRVGELRERLAEVTDTSDLHCVTGWSRLDNTWTGVRVADVLDLAGPRPEATHLVAGGHPAYSANLDLDAARANDVLLAWAHDGQPLAREHGGPLRLVVPARYGWKSVKWVVELRLTERDVPGYWEERGYHEVADPWREQRFRGD
jgi:DMSO/TMAO reductase YedYZ molybdopterin-dependent catalytic subunit